MKATHKQAIILFLASCFTLFPYVKGPIKERYVELYQFSHFLLDTIVQIFTVLFLNPINIFCLLFLFFNTLGYIFLLELLAKGFSKDRETFMRWDETKPDYSNLPMVSFIIPARNEEETIERKLRNTRTLNYPKDHLEVIVVDDASTDKTPVLLKEIKRSWFPQLKVIRQSRKGKSSAENTGLQDSKGEIIVISDADVPLNPEALHFMIEDFKDPRVGGVTCSIEADTRYVLALNLSLGLYARKLENEVDSIFGMSGPFVSFRRAIIPKIDEGIFSSDTDTGVAVRKKGYKVVYDPRIVSHVNQWVTGRPRTIMGSLKKLKHMSFGDVCLFLRHKDILFRNRYGVFGWVIAPRYLLLNIFAPIIFVLFSVNLGMSLIGSNFLVPFLLVTTLFLGSTVLSRKILPDSIVSRMLSLIFMYIVGYYARFFYYLLFIARSSKRRGMWSNV